MKNKAKRKQVMRSIFLLPKSLPNIISIYKIQAVFEHLGCTVSWKFVEGSLINPQNEKMPIASVVGPARKILLGERTALNLLSRASGEHEKKRPFVDHCLTVNVL
jgi:nicotinate-nucleotide pyrophosphorylase (carboxylating)